MVRSHALAFAVFGLGLAWPAAMLALAGGSLWYALTAIVMLAVAWGVWRRDRRAPWLQRPPWGMISAVDLVTRTLLWSRPFGTGRDSGPFGIASRSPLPMGVPNTGGAVTTGGGLTFIGASHDRYLRAIDMRTGRELWRARLPAGGQATPMTFWSRGSHRQFVVIAAGGHPGPGTKPGDYILAYALPPSP